MFTVQLPNFKFLNAGVASYSSYIYLKKIKKIINENNDLNIKDIIVFLDKSDVNDDDLYLSKPHNFQNKYPKGKFIFQRKIDFFPPSNLQFVCSQVTKQLKGLFFYYSGETLNTKVDTY